MNRYRNFFLTFVPGFSLAILLCLGFFGPSTALGAHKLVGSQCYDCHAVGASVDDVVTDSRLIRNDLSKISDLITNGWSTGTVLPCIYCHDGTSRAVRENMIGVQSHFTSGLSRHPVDPYTSSTDPSYEGGDETSLDCIDCHELSVVSYVKGGSSPGTTLSPNIHNQDVGAVAWTPEPGLVNYTATYKDWTGGSAGNPANAGNNNFCTNQCHDSLPGTGVDANQVYHQFRTPLVSLETNSTLYTAGQIGGCLDETSSTGCHAVHFSLLATDLITAGNYDTTTPISRDDCGACHVFDDPPTNRNVSDFFADGHGQTGIDLTCLDCHDSSIPHFKADGTPATGDSAGRLNFVLDTTQSGFSSPSKSALSVCTTSSCHDTYLEHAPSTSSSHPVGCLDCHDPHGNDVGSNVMMMRQSAPIASTTVTLSYANTGDWYNSAQGSGFTNWGCDSADCHPLSINAIMDTTTGTHGGGTGLKSGCENCHQHQGGEYSWAATGCDRGASGCHGNDSGLYWPNATGSDDGGTTGNDAGRHGLHKQILEADLGYSNNTTADGEQKTMCRYCHKVGDSDHTSSTRAEVFPTGFASSLWDTTGNDNATFTSGLNAGTCNNVDCHNNKTTSGTYQWYQSGSADCVMCHTAGGSAGDIANPVSGLHDEAPRVSAAAHDESFAYSSGALTGDCATCHPTPPSTRHLNGVDNSTINSTANTAVALTAGVGFADAATPTCSPSIAGCHLEQTVGESWTRLWHENSDQTDGTECVGCHGDFTSTWNTGTMHLTLPTRGNSTHANTGNLTYECTDCHGLGATTGNYAFTSSTNDWDANAGETSDHGDALITMNINGTSWTRVGGRSGCSACHEGATGTPNTHDYPQTSWTANTIVGDVPPVGCDGCHGGSGDYWPNTASIASTDYPDRAGRHSIHIAALQARNNYSTNDTDQKIMCQYCHNDPTSPPAGNSGHYETPTYIPPANVGDFNRLWDNADDANDSYNTSNDTCSNLDCHNEKATSAADFNWYASTTTTCTMCHSTDGTGTVDPNSGLHLNAGQKPTISGTRHDDTLTGCDTCHDSIPVNSQTSTHYNGVSNASSVTAMGLFSAYTQSQDSIGTCSGASVSGVSCHGGSQGAGDDGSWARLWNANVSYASDSATECRGCHGTFDAGWNFGMGNTVDDGHVSHERDWDGGSGAEIEANHDGTDKCVTCHTWDTAENYYTFSSAHRDNAIQMNNEASVDYSQSSHGCDGGVCHPNNAGHQLEDSGFTVAFNTGPAATCYNCHGNPTNETYWPDGSGPHTADDEEGRHNEHIGILETRLGYSAGTSNDAQQKAMCAYCHPQYGLAEFTTNHNDTGVDINTYVNMIGGGADADATFAVANSGTCTNFNCHNTKTQLSGFGWYGATTTTCTMCHSTDGTGTVDPDSGLHSATLGTPSVSQERHDDGLTACDTCHSAMPANSTTSTHYNAASNASSVTAMGLFSAYTQSADDVGTCSGSAVNTGCHDGAGELGGWARKWDDTIHYATNGDQCAGCHGTFTQGWVTGTAPNHAAAAWSLRYNHDNGASTETEYNQCISCHVYNHSAYGSTNNLGWQPAGTSGKHGDNLLTMNTGVGYNSTTWNCSAACHGSEAKYTMSDSGWTTDPVAGPAPDCTGCHTGSGAGGLAVSVTSPHAQSNTNFNYTGTGVTTGSSSQGCKDCHFDQHSSQATSTVRIPNNTIMGINYSIAGGTGVYIFAYGGATTEADVCWNCHAQRNSTTALEYDGTGTYLKEGTLNQTKWYNGTSWANWTSSDFEYMVDGTTAYKRNLALQTTHDVGVTTSYPVNKTTHMASSDRSTNRDNFRCSWCHDVHGIMGYARKTSTQTYSSGNASVTWGTATGETVYLRGIWYASPYMEDGAPGPGTSGGTTGGFTFPANVEDFVEGADDASNTPGEVNGTWGNTFFWADTTTPTTVDSDPPHLVGPNHLVRIQALSTVTDTGTNDTDWPVLKWGTHIDDNVYGTSGFYGHNPSRNNDPDPPINSTSLGTVNHYDYSAAAATAEQLCMKCHGTLANLRSNWSGHNAVRGGTAANTADIFTGTMAVHQHYMYNIWESGWSQSAGDDPTDTGYAGELTSDFGWGTGSYYDWSVDLSLQAQSTGAVDNSTAAKNFTDTTSYSQKFHQFTCSKCHTPHASANARLMITNCMNRDTTAGTYSTFNDDASLNRIVGSQDATDVRNIFTDLPEPTNQDREITRPWISAFGGHERAVHCHNNMEQGSSSTFWQSLN